MILNQFSHVKLVFLSFLTIKKSVSMGDLWSPLKYFQTKNGAVVHKPLKLVLIHF